MKKSILIGIGIASVWVWMLSLQGCALGSASAGYSLRCKTAEELSTTAENRLVERITEDVLREIQKKK